MRAIHDIEVLGEALATAVSEAQWERAVEILVERRQLLEAAFCEPPQDETQLAQLRELAEQVIGSDRELVAAAQAARQATVADVRQINANRLAAHAYQENAR
ncbi:MAG: flagellar protein FliT [Gammaproteobacteria bacterium]|nr:flagellar protein FliT [Gammaproteobacteria bacterium]